MQTILLIANNEKPAALRLAHDAESWLTERGRTVIVDSEPESDLSLHHAELVVVFGGDGTVLRAVGRLGDNPPPLLTVNLGRLGFMAEIAPNDVCPMLERVLRGDYKLSERMLLSAEVFNGNDRIVWHGHAVNEFVVAPAKPGRVMQIEVRAADHPLTTFAGDGLIVSTPTGSTAYALSAGGPIVSPELRAMLLVPICPHHLSNRPLVLDEREVITVRHLGDGCARFATDGREPICLDPASRAEIRVSDCRFHLILGQRVGRYDILRNKLGWGGDDLRQCNPEV